MVLGRLVNALRPGGTFSFETRNPAVRAWERRDPLEVLVERDTWLAWQSAHSDTVLYFRAAEDITSDLDRARFGGVEVRGGWHDEPVTADSPILVFRAVAR